MSGIPLKDNSRIIIIGGGPAGCFFALHTLQLMKKKGIMLNIKILEQRDFTTAGPKGCNMCAGIIGGNVVDEISHLGVDLDRRVIRHNVEGFRIFIDNLNVKIKKRRGDRIYTIFRNQGPMGVKTDDEIIGFDTFILKKTIDAGVAFKKASVVQVIPRRKNDKGIVIYRDPDGNEVYEKADLIVVACGVNTALTRTFEFGYKPPRCWHTCQAEIEFSTTEQAGDFIYIFSRKTSPFLFTALTPKGKYMTLTGIGKWVKFKDLLNEMERLSIKKLFPGAINIPCHCHPRIPVSTAKNPYSDGIVMIGDACVSRYLKNGIESALFTSKWAAETAIEHGIDSDSFDRYYMKRIHEFFTIDNRYGKVMFLLHRFVTSNHLVAKGCFQVLKQENTNPGEKYWLSDILWHMFAGDKPYRRIFRKIFVIKKIMLLLKNILGSLYGRR